MNCRHCGASLELPLIDLGSAPPSNAFLTERTLRMPEKWYPLRVLVCEKCWLVQTEDFAEAEDLFDANYAYFSGYSSSWLAHCERYVEDMVARYELGQDSHVVEIAANDGSLLQYFSSRGIPCTGIEPTASTAHAAIIKGLDIIEEFFSPELARTLASDDRSADLVVANNVLAHVPDINGFVEGVSALLKSTGIATFEFQHLLRLIQNNQFDTIYHEHFSYLSLHAIKRILATNRLTIFDVEEHPTHGGSLRVFAQRADSGTREATGRVDQILDQEADFGLLKAHCYKNFQARANLAKDDFLALLLDIKRQGKTIAAFGAAAKGNTLLNFAGVRPDLLPFVVDSNPSKQGRYMPGSRIPIVEERRLRATKPDYIAILPWNLKAELTRELVYARDWSGKFITVIPKIEIL